MAVRIDSKVERVLKGMVSNPAGALFVFVDDAMQNLNFKFFAPTRFFKSDAYGEEKSMRIAGVVSTEAKDRQGETILQRGLDFSDFMEYGWFNDNHSQKTSDILGYPEGVQYFSKGSTLPDGTRAGNNLHWAEGYLLPDEAGRKIWEKGIALQKTASGRTLGFSVEGKIKQRINPDRKTIAKALVRNIAITATPVNGETRLNALIKSMQAAEEAFQTQEPWDLVRSLMDQFGEPVSQNEGRYLWKSGDAEIEIRYEKALSAGPATPGQAPVGPRTGEGAGAILMPESLERKKHSSTYKKAEALRMIQQRLGTNPIAAERVYNLALAVENRSRSQA